jgi:hypothetical protein
MRRVHYFSGLIITIFIVLHLFNHFCSLWGANIHIEVMNTLRPVYRTIFSEIVLLSSVTIQIITGITLFCKKLKNTNSDFEKLQIWTGLYLSVFFVIHLSAVIGGRYIFHLDTNFYFGVAGLNTFPYNIFFIPYYGLAIIAFFGHVAAIHHKKMKYKVLGITPKQQAKAIIFMGICLMILIFYGLTNHFAGVKIPDEYNILIGK